LVVFSIQPRYRSLLTISSNANIAQGELSPEIASELSRLGVSPSNYATFFTALETIAALAFLTVAAVIFLRRSSHRAALMISGALLPFGAIASPLLDSLVTSQAAFRLPVLILRAVGGAGIILAFYLFPDGRFVPPRTRWLALLWGGYTLSWLLFPSLQLKMSLIPGNRADRLLALVFFAFALSAVGTQVYRYRRVSDARQRQQTKWVVFGFGLTIFLGALVGLPLLLFPSLGQVTPTNIAFRLLAFTVTLIGEVITAVAIGISILRYRLWDIDNLINRTLVYGALTGTLAVIYLIGVVLIQTIFPTQNQLATVLSTLSVAVLFNPLRRRIQEDIDRRFYRRRYDAAQALNRFATIARDEVELLRLERTLLGVVEEALKPSRSGLWLRQAGRVGPRTPKKK
jgi:hypothetical protein